MTSIRIVLLSAALAATLSPGPLHGDDLAGAEAAIRALLAEQSAAWNRGDLPAFTAVYDDDALFVSPSGTTRGRAAVLARYRDRYPDGRAMGRLTLDIEEVRLTPSGGAACEPAGARVLARWTLLREGETPRTAPTGPTLLVLERRDGRWWIVEDASMTLEKPAAPAG